MKSHKELIGQKRIWKDNNRIFIIVEKGEDKGFVKWSYLSELLTCWEDRKSYVIKNSNEISPVIEVLYE
jgi:hypothetical protein